MEIKTKKQAIAVMRDFAKYSIGINLAKDIASVFNCSIPVSKIQQQNHKYKELVYSKNTKSIATKDLVVSILRQLDLHYNIKEMPHSKETSLAMIEKYVNYCCDILYIKFVGDIK